MFLHDSQGRADMDTNFESNKTTWTLGENANMPFSLLHLPRYHQMRNIKKDIFCLFSSWCLFIVKRNNSRVTVSSLVHIYWWEKAGTSGLWMYSVKMQINQVKLCYEPSEIVLWAKKIVMLCKFATWPYRDLERARGSERKCKFHNRTNTWKRTLSLALPNRLDSKNEYTYAIFPSLSAKILSMTEE